MKEQTKQEKGNANTGLFLFPFIALPKHLFSFPNRKKKYARMVAPKQVSE